MERIRAQLADNPDLQQALGSIIGNLKTLTKAAEPEDGDESSGVEDGEDQNSGRERSFLDEAGARFQSAEKRSERSDTISDTSQKANRVQGNGSIQTSQLPLGYEVSFSSVEEGASSDRTENHAESSRSPAVDRLSSSGREKTRIDAASQQQQKAMFQNDKYPFASGSGTYSHAQTALREDSSIWSSHHHQHHQQPHGPGYLHQSSQLYTSTLFPGPSEQQYHTSYDSRSYPQDTYITNRIFEADSDFVTDVSISAPPPASQHPYYYDAHHAPQAPQGSYGQWYQSHEQSPPRQQNFTAAPLSPVSAGQTPPWARMHSPNPLTGSLPGLRTLSHLESSFARRLTRFALEKAYFLLTLPRKPPGELERIFKTTFISIPKECMIEYLANVLQGFDVSFDYLEGLRDGKLQGPFAKEVVDKWQGNERTMIEGGLSRFVCNNSTEKTAGDTEGTEEGGVYNEMERYLDADEIEEICVTRGLLPPPTTCSPIIYSTPSMICSSPEGSPSPCADLGGRIEAWNDTTELGEGEFGEVMGPNSEHLDRQGFPHDPSYFDDNQPHAVPLHKVQHAPLYRPDLTPSPGLPTRQTRTLTLSPPAHFAQPYSAQTAGDSGGSAQKGPGYLDQDVLIGGMFPLLVTGKNSRRLTINRAHGQGRLSRPHSWMEAQGCRGCDCQGNGEVQLARPRCLILSKHRRFHTNPTFLINIHLFSYSLHLSFI